MGGLWTREECLRGRAFSTGRGVGSKVMETSKIICGEETRSRNSSGCTAISQMLSEGENSAKI